MRLEGNFSNSTNGIESLVNLNKFIVQGFGTDDRSAVDYLYFSDIVHNTHRVSQFSDTTEYSWFRLDDVGLTIYECDGLALD